LSTFKYYLKKTVIKQFIYVIDEALITFITKSFLSIL